MVDIAVAYNPELRCCDVVFNGTDFAMDATPVSAMLVSLLTRRRAPADAALPTPITNWSEPPSFTARGGYPGDALDPNGALTGSLNWLYERSLAGEATRQRVEASVADAVAWLETVRGFALSLVVRYVAPQILGYKLRAGNTVVQLRLSQASPQAGPGQTP